MNNKTRQRFYIHRNRIAKLFGQTLFIDFTYTSELSLNNSQTLAKDIAELIKLNRAKFVEPYNIIFCNVNYNHHVWKILTDFYADYLKHAEHTSRSFLELCQDKSKLVYISNMIKSSKSSSHLVYDGDAEYVMAALVEKDIAQDFLTPSVRKLCLPIKGFPIDKFVVWRMGSKRFSLAKKSKLIDHLKFSGDWRQAILNTISEKRLKNENEIKEEDQIRIFKLQYKSKSHQKLRNNSSK